VKPSERIRGAAQILLTDRYNIDQIEKPVDRNALTASVFAAEILVYLDKQHEREERRREVLRLTLAVLSGRLFEKQPGDIVIGPPPGPRPELPARVKELVAGIAAYPNRNWSIPEREDYFEALLRWLEESEAPA
jgi:hypothetical protein